VKFIWIFSPDVLYELKRVTFFQTLEIQSLEMEIFQKFINI